MAAKKSANGNGGKTTRTKVDLSTVGEGQEAVWPGQSRNGTASALRLRLTDDIEGMEMGSVRSYPVSGSREQVAFLNLFRSLVARIWGDDMFGVRAVRHEDEVFVMFGEPIKRPRKAAASK